jgi:hypothetical protein
MGKIKLDLGASILLLVSVQGNSASLYTIQNLGTLLGVEERTE